MIFTIMNVLKIVLTLTIASVKWTNGCLYPTGLTSTSAPDVPSEGIILSMFIAADPYIIGYEPAIQFRLIMLEEIGLYAALAAFEPNALDMFARVELSEERRRCQDMDATLFDIHRRVTLAYAVFYALLASRPDFFDDGTALLAEWGLDGNICHDTSSGYDCLNDISTPWGFAFTVNEEGKEFMLTDGWNADGSYSRQFNKIPYQDFRDNPYIPRNSPWELEQS